MEVRTMLSVTVVFAAKVTFIFFASVMVGARSSTCGTKVSTPLGIWVEGFSSAKYLSMHPRVIKEIFNKWR